MKTPTLLLGLVLLASAPVQADPADQAYAQGLAAMQQGDPAKARASFQKALALRLDHAYARYQLGRLKSQAGTLVAKKRARQLSAVVLPSIDFREVALSDALAALNQMVETQSGQNGGKTFTPNFMVQDPSGKLKDREVTLTLKNVPAKSALDYILNACGAMARYDEHAIVVRPTTGGGVKRAE